MLIIDLLFSFVSEMANMSGFFSKEYYQSSKIGRFFGRRLVLQWNILRKFLEL